MNDERLTTDHRPQSKIQNPKSKIRTTRIIREKEHRMDRFAAHIDANRARYYDELCALLRRPSIAAQGLGLEETAALVAARLERLGAAVQVLRMPGAAPVVYATIGQGARTLLVYD